MSKRVLKAKLVKLQTDDGLVRLNPDVELGKTYLVYPESIKQIGWHNTEVNQTVRRESIWVEPSGWMPLELLEVEATDA
jgi:hypothetical protein